MHQSGLECLQRLLFSAGQSLLLPVNLSRDYSNIQLGHSTAVKSVKLHIGKFTKYPADLR
jgi:hypothetical protein